MGFNKQELKELILERELGIINLEDELKLSDILSNNIEAKKLERYYLDTLDKKILKSDDFFNEDQAWLNVDHKLSNKRNAWILPSIGILAAAAVICLVFFIFDFKQIPTDNKVAVHSFVDSSKVALLSSDGKLISFDSNSNLSDSAQIIGEKYYESNNNSDDLNWLVLQVPIGEIIEFKLRDGTKIFLNSNSKLKFPSNFTSDKREVFLEGEAYFSVSHNKDQPFIVHSEGSSIQVLGTEFNVNSYTSGKTVASLITGSILATDSQNKSFLIKPGFEIESNVDALSKIIAFDPYARISWKDGIYNFSDEKIDQIAPILKRWFGIDIKFENVAWKKLSFSGKIDKNKSIDVLIKNLELTSGKNIELRNNILVFN